MADPAALSHAFMRTHPGAAAQVLESLAPAEAAALFLRTPARLGATVLAAMLPAAAARSLGALEDERAMALVSGLGAQPAVAILRRIPEPRRARLLAGLHGSLALAARLLLGFPEDTVGAWADPDLVALAPDTRAGEALERVRRSDAGAGQVFVVDADQRLQGMIGLAALLRVPEGATLGALMARAETVLAARTALAAAATHPGWRGTSALPVVEAGDRLLGVITRDALARALERLGGAARRSAEASLPGMLARAYWDSLASLAEATVALLPATRPAGGKAHER